MEVAFHWIRGHTGIKGNVKADEIAKNAISNSPADLLTTPCSPENKKKLKLNLIKKLYSAKELKNLAK